jgi:nucleoside-diphosphate-sugar epimerase
MMLQSVVTARSIPMCILRPVAVFGVGDTHNSYGPNRFVREALASRTITLFGTGGDERSHLYVDDAARLISRCVQRVSTGSLNLAHPESLTFLQIAEMVRAHLPFVTEVKFTGGTAPAPSRRPFDVRQLCDAFPDFEFTPTYEALRVFVSAKVGSPVSRR